MAHVGSTVIVFLMLAATAALRDGRNLKFCMQYR